MFDLTLIFNVVLPKEMKPRINGPASASTNLRPVSIIAIGPVVPVIVTTSTVPSIPSNEPVPPKIVPRKGGASSIGPPSGPLGLKSNTYPPPYTWSKIWEANKH